MTTADLATLETLLRRIVREELQAMTGSALAEPASLKQRVESGAAEHLRRLGEKRQKRQQKHN